MLAEVSVQPTSDPNVKAYHTRFEMSSGPEEGTRGNSEEMGAFGNLILEIRGITQIHVCPYILLVTKAPLFEWTEIDPNVEKILSEFVRSQRQLEEAHANPVRTPAGVEKPRTPGPRAIRKSF